MRRRAGELVTGLLLSAIGFFTSGCQTPNVKPFHDATVTMHSAVRQAYNITWSRLDSYEAIDKSGAKITRSSTNHPANRFTNGWTTRLQVMESMVSYSESLANVVNSGESSKANAKAISDQLTKLVETTPWSVYGEAAKSIFQEVHGLAVSVAQYHSLAKAIAKADKPVQRAAAAIIKDMESLEMMLTPLLDDQTLGIVTKYNNHRAYQNEVLFQRTEFEKQALLQRKQTDRPRLKLLAASASTNATEIDKLTKDLENAQRAQKMVDEALAECDALLARVADTQAAFQAEVKDVKETRAAALDLVRSTREAIRLWAAAHNDLQAAIAGNRQPNVSLLVSSALEIRETIRKIKDHE